ncbi:hypothetical protein Pcinc_039092 [Petrolisthes cinctipes]|uniref:Uncharacterized protein n=1 Tax=Petrolisthes cinctipes TaxID=88211 RepID=A0AAE1BE18_PETCI|nr:hypothetical protein Pcinc_044384 [Petrolisthes cinctipes]KAK3854434.1 hypothetical protein Pcinc_039092 [Petrolisthes cinctipes]
MGIRLESVRIIGFGLDSQHGEGGRVCWENTEGEATHRSTPLKNARPAQSPHDKIGGRVLVVVSGEGPLVGERNLQPVWDIIIV